MSSAPSTATIGQELVSLCRREHRAGGHALHRHGQEVSGPYLGEDGRFAVHFRDWGLGIGDWGRGTRDAGRGTRDAGRELNSTSSDP
jgi:hypothetical protein